MKVDEKRKEYRDKVLEKAVEYIKGELSKQAQAEPLPGQEQAPAAERRDRQLDGDERIAVPSIRRNNQANRDS